MVIRKTVSKNFETKGHWAKWGPWPWRGRWASGAAWARVDRERTARLKLQTISLGLGNSLRTSGGAWEVATGITSKALFP